MHFKILICCFGALLTGCGNNPQSETPQATTPIEEVTYDLKSFAPLKAEVLVREHATSLVKYVKFQDQYIAGFGDTIDLELSLFIFKNGKAKVLAHWVYPEYLSDGGKLRRAHEALFEMPWELTDAGVVLGDEMILISQSNDGEYFGGVVKPRSFEPPPFPLTRLVPEVRDSIPSMEPVRFQVVSELVEATWVVEIFGR
jgi:hypothetical protein